MSVPPAFAPFLPAIRPHVVLVRGCPRSGTTLLAQLLNLSPEVGLLYEYSLGAFVRDLMPSLSYGRLERRLRAIVDRAPRDSDGRFYDNAVPDDPPPTYPTDERFAAMIAAAVAASLGKGDLHVIGSKTPGSVALGDRAVLEPYFATVVELFMMRDPLATINSMINRRNRFLAGFDRWPWLDVTASIREYRQSVRSLLSSGLAFPSTRVVSYDDLVRDFEGVASDLFAAFALAPLSASAAATDGAAQLTAPREPATDVLTQDERAAVFDAFGDAIDAWPGKRLSGPAAQLGGALDDCLDAFDAGGAFFYGGADGERRYLGNGWSVLQDEGVWSDAAEAHLLGRVPEAGEYALDLEFDLFLPLPASRMTVTATVGDAVCMRADFDRFGSSAPYRMRCGPIAVAAGRALHVVLRIDAPFVPADCGISSDDRSLGVLLRALRCVRATTCR